MPVTHYSKVYELAEPQHGYFTTAQAGEAGIGRNVLTKMAQRGVLERLSTGVYRLTNYPPFVHGQLLEATLWPADGIRGVISHESALSYYGLSDASPSKVHITVPVRHRIRRLIPPVLVVHHADLRPDDATTIDGIFITTARRAVIDCHQAHLGPALVRQAIEDGQRTGWLTTSDANELTTELNLQRGNARIPVPTR